MKYLRIYPDTFIWRSAGEGIVYNSINKSFYEFKSNDSIDDACNLLDDLSNLYCVPIENSSDIEFKKWLDNNLLINACEVVDVKNFIPSMKPFLRIQNDLSVLRSNGDLSSVKSLISNIAIHLDETPCGDEILSRQVLFPTAEKADIDIDALYAFLHNMCKDNRIRLSIIIDDSLSDRLIQFINKVRQEVSDLKIIIDWHSFRNALEYGIKNILFLARDNFTVNIVVPPYLLNDFVTNHRLMYDHNSYSHILLVDSEDRLALCQNSVPESDKYVVLPVYNGTNLPFFRQYVCTVKDDIFTLSKREIFQRQALNGNFFGKLEIANDGSVYDKPGIHKFGNIEGDIKDVLYSILNSDNLWFLTRDKTTCKNCMYRYLCPPPSIYEILLSKYNMCFKDNS